MSLTIDEIYFLIRVGSWDQTQLTNYVDDTVETALTHARQDLDQESTISFDQGYNSGYDAGFKDGREAGYDDGFQSGESRGYQDGLRDGDQGQNDHYR